ncbi:MAG: hypothetical protein AAGE52_07520 [Myxococcota bacterium]
MIHYLTMDLLHLPSVLLQQTHPLGDLPREVRRTVFRLSDPGRVLAVEGHPIVLERGFVRAVWYAPRKVRATVVLAKVAAAYGCVLAEVRRARIVNPAELT